MQTESTTILFFAVACNGDATFEISRNCFENLLKQAGDKVHIQYDRYTVFEHGADQICLTLDLDDWPDAEDLDLVNAMKES